MNIIRRRKYNYSKEELEKAELLEAYTRQRFGEKLSRKQHKLLQSQQYLEELESLKKIVDFAHQHAHVTVEHTLPRPGASQRVENTLMNLIRGKETNEVPHVGNAQPVYSHEQVGSDSELVQVEYNYESAEESIPEECIPKTCLVQFKIVGGDEVGKEYTMTVPQVTLGRGQDTTIQLEEDNQISRVHAQLDASAGDVYITDLDSNNGTYVDEQSIVEQTKFKVGSHIRLGNTSLSVVDIQSSVSEVRVKFKKLENGEMGVEYNVTLQENTIGRGKKALIRLRDSSRKLSRIHARLNLRNGNIYITDLNSSNGTCVDDRLITEPQKLSVGSIAQLGGVSIQILAIGQ